MSTSVLPPQKQLAAFSRMVSIRRAVWAPTPSALHWTEVLFLIGCGLLASTAVLALEFKLRLPGHSILRVIFPMAFGFAMVPRVGAGTTMGAGAIGGAFVAYQLQLTERGYGSLTSLVLTGPLLDFALRRAQSGFQVYARLIAAGLASNVVAMLVQVIAKSLRLEAGGGKGIASWLPMAALTYPLFGIAAGLISAAVWFRLHGSGFPGQTLPQDQPTARDRP